MRTSAFGKQTTVERHPRGGGRYGAVVSDEWNAPVLPHGGVVTALALRAMAAELDLPDESLRSVTTVFAAQVPPGPVDIDVTVLRRGRTMSQATATVRPVGADSGHTAVAIFGGSRHGFEFTDVTCPEVPPPEQCPSFRDPLPEGVTGFAPASFWERVESRPAIGHAPWHQWEPVSSERVYWYRFDDPPVTEAGEWDPLALVTLCDTMPGAVGERMGPGLPPWFGPSADLTVHILGTASSPWLLGHNRARHAGDGYASVEMELWDPERGLVAYATQMMFFSFPDGPPSPEQRRPPG
ncbi:MAG TPA: thioesterase family protein [Acidimicrobiales bacterium]